jgi:hypothetical protein
MEGARPRLTVVHHYHWSQPFTLVTVSKQSVHISDSRARFHDGFWVKDGSNINVPMGIVFIGFLHFENVRDKLRKLIRF